MFILYTHSHLNLLVWIVCNAQLSWQHKVAKGGKEELTIENTSHGMCISEQFVYYCAMYELEAQEYKKFVISA